MISLEPGRPALSRCLGDFLTPRTLCFGDPCLKLCKRAHGQESGNFMSRLCRAGRKTCYDG
jgi:hypothetical protein